MFWILLNLCSGITNLMVADGWDFSMIIGVLNIFTLGFLLGKA